MKDGPPTKNGRKDKKQKGKAREKASAIIATNPDISQENAQKKRERNEKEREKKKKTER